MLRFRGVKPSKKTIEAVKSLDAFPKVPDSYVETTASGATVTIITCILICFLVISEILYFLNTRFEYEYKVDVEFDTKVWLNFDITIATPCSLIGADVVDVTDQVLVHDAKIEEEPTQFELSADEQKKRRSVTPKNLINYEDGQQLNEMALKQSAIRRKTEFVANKNTVSRKKANACRFFGNIPLTKVAGNFHVVSGKPVDMFGAHAHLSFMMAKAQYNFSHRIDHFSFGDMRSGLVNALDGVEKVSSASNFAYHYYLDIVSTKVQTYWLHSNTYQFSVSELSRELNHMTGSHGMPGIFFKYGFSPVCVIIKNHSIPFGRFLVRLCGIIGGVFATSCIVNGLITSLHSMVSSTPIDSKSKIKAEGKTRDIPPSNDKSAVDVQTLLSETEASNTS